MDLKLLELREVTDSTNIVKAYYIVSIVLSSSYIQTPRTLTPILWSQNYHHIRVTGEGHEAERDPESNNGEMAEPGNEHMVWLHALNHFILEAREG